MSSMNHIAVLLSEEQKITLKYLNNPLRAKGHF